MSVACARGSRRQGRGGRTRSGASALAVGRFAGRFAGRTVGLALPAFLAGMLAGLLMPVSGAAAQQAPGTTPFAEPPVLENRAQQPGHVEVTLTAAPARVELLDGVETEVLAFNGSVPGPTLELAEGDRVTVHFRNELDRPTTVHWHGLHLPFRSDGSPFHPVAPGDVFTYEFTVHPGTAGTYWYHPHPHHDTGNQVARGLFGAVVVQAPGDPLPAAIQERLLILSDNRFTPGGMIDFAEAGTRQARADAENGREGDVLFVNGQIMPELAMAPGELQRWRIINASSARTYRLELEGKTLLHIGSDGGLFARPDAVHEILLAGGERAELLVRGGEEPGESTLLRSLPYDRYLPQTRPTTWTDTLDLMAIRVSTARGGGAPAAASPRLPGELRPVPVLDPATATRTRTMTLTKDRINGRMMDMGRIDATSHLGSTEVWEIENLVGMDHTFHLHGFQFQLLEDDGSVAKEPRWKDVVNVPRRSTVRFVVRFDRYPGLWMFHCHILEHEDAGMMGVLQVIDPEIPFNDTQLSDRIPHS